MKTKIVFVTRRMMMGGIEKALISMLENMPEDKFDVTLLTVHSGGELFDKIPSHVKVKNVFDNERTIVQRAGSYVKRGKLISAFRVVVNAFLLKRGVKSDFDEFVCYSKTRQFEDVKYDLAISYSGLMAFPVVYVAKNINAKRKIAWIHSDVSDLGDKTYSSLVKKLRRHYKLYDNIFCVSHHAVREFNEVFPELGNNISVFYNILDSNKVEQLSLKNEGFNDHFNGIRILTVGRLGGEKGQELIPSVLSRLLSVGYNVRWYCIGDGGIRSRLESMIREFKLSNNFILLGTKDNPYPYLKDCDLYVQPSRHEAYCITVAEARALNKPIITTDTGASEQIEHEKTGLIVNFDEDQMYEAIKRLLSDETLRNKLIKNLSLESADTKEEMKKLYQVTENISRYSSTSQRIPKEISS